MSLLSYHPEILRADLEARYGARRRAGERRSSSLAILLRAHRERKAGRAEPR